MELAARFGRVRLWLRPPGHRAWLGVIALLTALALNKGLRLKLADFTVYARAVRRFWSAEELYRATDLKMQFKYAPHAPFLFSPWAVLGRQIGGTLWNLTSIAVLVWVAWVLVYRKGWLRDDLSDRARSWLPTVATAALAPSFFWELSYGQVDIAILGLLVAAMLALRSARDWSAGVALGVLAALKPPAGLMAIYVLWRRRYYAVVTTVVVVAVTTVPVLLLYGAEGAGDLMASWRSSLEASTLPWSTASTSVGLPTLLLAIARCARPVTPEAFLAAQLAALAIFVGLLVIFRPRDAHLFAALSLGTAVLSPLAWRANLVLAWPALVLVLDGDGTVWARRIGASLAVVIALAGFFLAPWLFTDAGLRAFLVAYRPFTLIVLALLVLLLWRGRTRWVQRAPVEVTR